MNSIIDCYKKYAVFRGRACRKEFWLFMLYFLFCLYFPALLVDFNATSVTASEYIIFPLWILLFLGNIIPSIAVAVRRLHDIDKSGWWYLFGYVPLLGLILFVFYCQKGTAGDNRFGSDPID